MDKDPLVFQVPDLGDHFWIYAVYDARTDQIAQIGKPYGTKPCFYLIVGPRWKGKIPAGAMTPTTWVPPERFFDNMVAVLKLVPLLPGGEALHRWIASVWRAAARDSELKKALTASFATANQEMVAPLFGWKRNGHPVGNGGNSPFNSARWGTGYFNRAATAVSNVFENVPNGTKCFYRDSGGGQLLGHNIYIITFPPGQRPRSRGSGRLPFTPIATSSIPPP